MKCPKCNHDFTPPTEEPAYQFREAFDDFLETESVQSVASVQKAEKRFLLMAEYFFTQERNLTDLGAVRIEDLQRLAVWLALPQKTATFTKETWSKPTLAGNLKILKEIFRKAHAHERIKKDPAAYWKIPRGKCKPRRPMTPEEFAVVYDAAQDWFKPVLAFLRLTASRGATAAALTWADIDFERGVLILRSNKGGGSETVMPLYHGLRQFLIGIANEKRSQQYVFVDRRGRPLTGGLISTTGSRIIKRCGLGGVVIYGIRHAMGAELTRAGVPLEITRQVLGHSNIAQTSHYSKMVGDEAIGKALQLVRPIIAVKSDGENGDGS